MTELRDENLLSQLLYPLVVTLITPTASPPFHLLHPVGASYPGTLLTCFHQLFSRVYNVEGASKSRQMCLRKIKKNLFPNRYVCRHVAVCVCVCCTHSWADANRNTQPSSQRGTNVCCLLSQCSQIETARNSTTHYRPQLTSAPISAWLFKLLVKLLSNG